MSKTRTATPPPKRAWCGLDLSEVVQLDLPAGVHPTIINYITRTISRHMTIGVEPFATLLRDGQVTRTRSKRKYHYQITEAAATILAAEARKHYDKHHANNQETPVPEQASSAPEASPPQPAAQPAPQTTEAPAARQEPTRPPQPEQPLALNEAIGELIRRHGVTPPLDDNLRLDLPQFVIELELAARPN